MRKIIKEFKDFISRGNVIDMAVGIIVGSAFTSIVNSLVNDIFMEIVTLITGKMDLNELVIPLGSGGSIKIGSFFSSVISFLIIAIAIFLLVKAINKIRDISRKSDIEENSENKDCHYCKMSVAKEATRCPHCTSFLEENSELDSSRPTE